jgi:hypothetical protein
MFQYAAGTFGIASLSSLSNVRRVDVQIADLAKVANADEVTFYTIDAKGLTGDGATAAADDPLAFRPGVSFFARTNAQSGMLELASQTGGIALINNNDFKGGLARVYQDASSYYSVGVNLSNLPAGVYQKIDIAVSRPGVTVRYRRGYATKTDDERARDVAARGSEDQRGVQLVSGQAAGRPFVEGEEAVRAADHGSAASLGSDLPPEGGSVESERRDLRWRRGRERPHERYRSREAVFTQPKQGSPDALAYPITLQMRKGNARVVVNVRDKVSGKMGTAKADIRVE